MAVIETDQRSKWHVLLTCWVHGRLGVQIGFGKMKAHGLVRVVRVSAGQASSTARRGTVRIIPLHLFDSMKIISAILVALWVSTCWANAQTASASLPVAGATTGRLTLQDTPYAVVSKGANQQVWQRTTYETRPDGKQIPHVHQYTELATGLHYWNNGQWVDSKEEINILPNGTAVATQGQQQAYFPGDIYQGVIELVTSDGKHLRTRPMGISYDDGTKKVLISELKDSVGQLVGPNQVIYPDAFTDFKADLVCTYRKSGFECDLVFLEQPPSPVTYGLNPQTSRLELLTEFFNTPEPVKTINGASRSDGLSDTTLKFGTMTMGRGKAFVVGDSTSDDARKPSSQIPVYKSWLHLQGRTFLMEEVPYQRIASQLKQLPASASAAPTKTSAKWVWNKISPRRLLPPARVVQASTNRVQLAKADFSRERGVVLDYVTINSGETNFTFQGDTTYYVSGEENLSGTTTFEGGTVIKLDGSGQIDIDVNGTINCQTGPYRPVVFTSINDNSVGEQFGSGSPAFGDVGIFLNIDATNASLHDLRFSYSWVPINQGWGSSPAVINVWDCQFEDVDVAIYGYNIELHNVLIGRSFNYDAAVFVEGTNMVGENVTADGGSAFLEVDGSGAIVALTNCLVTGQPLITGNPMTLLTNVTVWLPSPSTPVYQTVGAGSYYLTNNSPYCNAGTTNISPQLLAELKQKTTYPPIVLSGTTIYTATNLSPQTPRDTNTVGVDLGYHYDPLDYVFGGVDLYSNLTITAGTVVGYYADYGNVYSSRQPYGISLNDGASLTSSGTAILPTWIVRYDTVQEGGNGNWTVTGYMGGIMFNGSRSGITPQLNGRFTKWASGPGGGGFFRDNWAYGVGSFSDCEFYGSGMCSYWPSLYFTNCFFSRVSTSFFDQMDAASFTFQNCTFYEGVLAMARDSWQSPSFWTVRDSAFDGTAFSWSDNFNGDTNYTAFDYNAYNSANTDWQTYPYPYPPNYGTLEVVGPHDVIVTNGYNWQTSWLGNYYLPTDSPLIDMGNTNANLLGLYHFTTQTNQVKETNSVVDIGYHYVAVDANGNPLANYGDGIPDYLDDTDGNGLPDWWEIQYFGHIGIDPNADPDGDHLSNLQEYNLGTNPTNADTDGDGRTDWQEVMDGTDPLNPNSKATSIYKADAKMNTQPVTITTIPSLTIWASNGIAYVALTNGMTNVLYDLYGETNLLSSSWIWLGKLNILGQYTNATSVYQQFFWTLGGPLDSDGDGLTDDYESLVTHTDPNNPDSDYDGRSDGQEILLDGTDPNNCNSVTNVMLAYWRFDNTNTWVGEEGQLPILATNIVGVPSWGTNAVRIDTNTTAILKYHDVEPTNFAPANINCRNGTVQFWFAPDWDSGTGPGSPGRLIEMGSQTSTTGWWSLYFNTNGTQLIFGTQTNGLALTNLTVSINWTSNYWHQIVLTYSSNNSSLYVDGQPFATNGLGANYYPNRNERTNGFCIGSDLNGNNQARGIFDELQTFNYPLDATSIATNYQTMYQMDRDGDGLPDIWEMDYFGHLGVIPNDDPDGDGLNNLQEYILGTNPTVNEIAQSGSRLNYIYTLADWLNQISGIKNGTVTLDPEGNVTQASQ